MKMKLRQLKVLVKPNTMSHIAKMANENNTEPGMVVDELVREHCARKKLECCSITIASTPIRNEIHARGHIIRGTDYRLVDRDHNVWACTHCGHLERLEADGPKENGWVFCPHCMAMILDNDDGCSE